MATFHSSQYPQVHFRNFHNVDCYSIRALGKDGDDTRSVVTDRTRMNPIANQIICNLNVKELERIVEVSNEQGKVMVTSSGGLSSFEPLMKVYSKLLKKAIGRIDTQGIQDLTDEDESNRMRWGQALKPTNDLNHTMTIDTDNFEQKDRTWMAEVYVNQESLSVGVRINEECRSTMSEMAFILILLGAVKMYYHVYNIHQKVIIPDSIPSAITVPTAPVVHFSRLISDLGHVRLRVQCENKIDTFFDVLDMQTNSVLLVGSVRFPDASLIQFFDVHGTPVFEASKNVSLNVFRNGAKIGSYGTSDDGIYGFRGATDTHFAAIVTSLPKINTESKTTVRFNLTDALQTQLAEYVVEDVGLTIRLRIVSKDDNHTAIVLAGIVFKCWNDHSWKKLGSSVPYLQYPFRVVMSPNTAPQL